MINLSDSTPVAPSGGQNVKWQSDVSGNVSAYAPIAATRQTVAISSGVLTVNAALGSIIEVTLNQNITSIVVNNPVDGQELLFVWIQDATGSRTITFPASFKGTTAPSSAVNSFSQQKFSYRTADTAFRAIAAGVTGM
jgi:hypothetical protein